MVGLQGSCAMPDKSTNVNMMVPQQCDGPQAGEPVFYLFAACWLGALLVAPRRTPLPDQEYCSACSKHFCGVSRGAAGG
jgi:hypothetical protein